MISYKDFLLSKVAFAPETGFEISKDKINPALKPHQRDAVMWAVKGGRRALFEAFGLGKTVQELEWCRIITAEKGGKALIVMPLGVRQEFTKDAQELLGIPAPQYVRTMAEVKAAETQIVITNYERVRDGDIDPTYFTATALDEASCLRDYGSKTYQTFTEKFKGVPYKLVATATPSPNRYKELIHYAGFLEIMDTGQALTRFFQRDSTKANNLTLYPHKEQEFWLWLSSWSLFITKPSDLGYDDTGYALPPMEINYHAVSYQHKDIDTEKDGQLKLLADAAVSLKDAAKIKRDSIDARVAKMVDIVEANPDEHFILWHDLEAERHAIKKALPEAVEVYGSQDYDIREKRVIGFAKGDFKLLATKKSLSGQGCNFQYHCHRAIFLGIDYEFNDFIQAIHRIYRFMQTEKVIIDIIYTEEEQEILRVLLQKWKQHTYMADKMTEIIKKYGLANTSLIDKLARTMGVERVEVTGKYFKAVNNDCILETEQMADNSVDLIVTSIPFSNHYEYTATYNDFGHNQNTQRFFEQMNYLTPNLLRILRPGRVFACHVKDRVLFGNATGTGMPTMEPFHAMCIKHYMEHGFMYFGMITVVTDVVRENNQTYRLGWTEQCKDGTKMGVGCPEYILLFRKLPTDTSRAYADVPVTKDKADYTRAQWQIDAHGFWRSSGNRLLTKAELQSIPVDNLQAVYRKYSRENVYSYEEHVALAKRLDENGKLPASFMVVAPGSWNMDVWDDINRMRTLNTSQSRKRAQMHVCLAKGSLILTRAGYKPIEAIEIGDMVLTHKGNWKPVIEKRCTGINPVIQTKAQGVANLITTPDHKLWARKTDKVRAKDYMQKTEPAWIEAQNCKGGYVNLKLPAVEENNLTLQEWWIVGRYLADGHKGTRGDYFISVGKGKVEEFEVKAAGYFGTNRDGTARQYRLKNLPEHLKKMLEACGRGASNKQVPIAGICTNQAEAQALLDGYLSGDGNRTGNAVSATSVSRALLLGMAMVAQRAHGVIASIFKGKPAGKTVIEGRIVNTLQEWVMSWRESTHHHEGIILDDGAWKKVKEPIECDEAETWSIQVADDASYTAEGCIVKNCPLQLDIVERLINRYSNPGDVVLDPFGGLMTVPLVAVQKERFGIGIELSCDYFRDGVGYLQTAEMQRGEPTLFDFIEE